MGGLQGFPAMLRRTFTGDALACLVIKLELLVGRASEAQLRDHFIEVRRVLDDVPVLLTGARFPPGFMSDRLVHPRFTPLHVCWKTKGLMPAQVSLPGFQDLDNRQETTDPDDPSLLSTVCGLLSYSLTGRPFELRKSFACWMVYVPKWKIEATRTASAFPSVTAS